MQTIVAAQIGAIAGVQLVTGTLRQGYLHVLYVTAGTTGPATLTIYDNANSAAGRILALVAATTSTSSNAVDMGGTPFFFGLYAVVTGSGTPSAVVTYE